MRSVKMEFPLEDGTLQLQGTVLRGRDFRGMVGVMNASGDYVIGRWHRYIRGITEMPENPPAAYLHDFLFELRECEVFDLGHYHKRIGIRR